MMVYGRPLFFFYIFIFLCLTWIPGELDWLVSIFHFTTSDNMYLVVLLALIVASGKLGGDGGCGSFAGAVWVLWEVDAKSEGTFMYASFYFVKLV